MTPATQKALDDFYNARQALDTAIMSEMDAVARSEGLTEMSFGLGTYYYRRKKEVQVPEIDRLDEVYCDTVNRCGFQALWTRKKGWC